MAVAVQLDVSVLVVCVAVLRVEVAVQVMVVLVVAEVVLTVLWVVVSVVAELAVVVELLLMLLVEVKLVAVLWVFVMLLLVLEVAVRVSELVALTVAEVVVAVLVVSVAVPVEDVKVQVLLVASQQGSQQRLSEGATKRERLRGAGRGGGILTRGSARLEPLLRLSTRRTRHRAGFTWMASKLRTSSTTGKPSASREASDPTTPKKGRRLGPIPSPPEAFGSWSPETPIPGASRRLPWRCPRPPPPRL